MSMTKRLLEKHERELELKHERLLDVPTLVEQNTLLIGMLTQQLVEANDTVSFLRTASELESARAWKVRLIDWIASGVIGAVCGYSISLLGS